MAKLSDYLKDDEGNPSSSRLFSHRLLWFFIGSNTLIWLGIFFGKATIDMNFLLVFLIFDALVLLGAFAPKQLSKIEEVRKLIELAKNGK